MLQNINYNENPIDIPNPDRGGYRGRWQNIPPELADSVNSPFGITPEVDHRVPVDETSVLYHGRQVPAIEGDDVEVTEFHNGERHNLKKIYVNENFTDFPYVGGTGISAMPSIAFMGFDLVNFSSNAFLSAADAFGFLDDGQFIDPKTGKARTGKTGALTKYALDYIRGLLQKVRDGNACAFVKFSYDGNGFNYFEPHKYPHLSLKEGLIHDPEPTAVTEANPSGMCTIDGHTDKNWIEYHIHQLKPIFHEFEDIIMCVKTGMVGAWGEQHSSKESQTPHVYKYLLDAYLDAVPSSRSLLTHAGGFLAWYNLTYGTKYTFHDIDKMPEPLVNSPESRFGFFNDSYAAGGADISDNGSLSEGGFMLTNGDVGYDRYRIIKWIGKQNNFLQGEGGLNPNEFSTMPAAIVEAQNLKLTALNMRHGNYSTWGNIIYNEANISKTVKFPGCNKEYNVFYDPVYEGRTCLEYMRDRLGYRLVLRESNLVYDSSSNALKICGKVQNVGFGNIINKKDVCFVLMLKEDKSAFIIKTDIDARNWTAAADGNSRADNLDAYRAFEYHLPELPKGNAFDVYLKIKDSLEKSDNKRCVRFANFDIWNAELGANYIGTFSCI